MLKTSLCDYGEAYILASETTTITGAGTDDAVKWLDERNKGVIFKNCAPFTDCIREINNTQIDNAKYLDVVMLMYNLIEYYDNYSKASASLWRYYKDDPNDNPRLKYQKKLLLLVIQRMLKNQCHLNT